MSEATELLERWERLVDLNDSDWMRHLHHKEVEIAELIKDTQEYLENRNIS